MSLCRGCGAAIEWIRMKSGKSMPVDPEPQIVAEGGSQVFVTDEGETITGRLVDREPAEGVDVEVAFVPHWATCPEARKFRKK